jgi:acetyl-CoA synthetase
MKSFDADKVLGMIEKYQITTFCAPPTIFRFFVKQDLSKYNLKSLKYVTTAGEALNPEVHKQFMNATGLAIMEGFGQTETTCTVFNQVGTTPKPGSMGKPNPQYKMHLINGEGKEAVTGEEGEICLECAPDPIGLFQGYYGDEQNTKAAKNEGLYHTGDTAWRDEDGYFWYVGRTDDLIKSSGYRIGPFEIESVIMEIPNVLECAVTAVPDPVRGQIVKATIVLTKGAVGTDEMKKEIQNYVKEHTAPYKYPRIVEFVTDLPKTVNGKIRRSAIRNETKA